MADARYAAVLGSPISHSLSPRLHNYWLKEYNIKGEYTAIEVNPDLLFSRLKMLADKGFKGVNLTLPLKEKALELMDEVDETAKRIGAVNTVIMRDKNLIGCNTDAYGFTQNLITHNVKLVGTRVLVMGAGGASCAVCAGLQQEGAIVTLVNRTQDKAESLSKSLGGTIKVLGWDKLPLALEETELLVNTTSQGMKYSMPLALSLAPLPFTAVVTDIVYNPLLTPLLKDAQARGNTIVDGLGMLLYQAQPAFKAWFGVEPKVSDELRAHVLEGLA